MFAGDTQICECGAVIPKPDLFGNHHKSNAHADRMGVLSADRQESVKMTREPFTSAD